ncbi:hypothetical protein GWI33_008082 [Rhynchophorus ferrugineus]|uniref:Uncharacterized protein n=1 Tax=Rhynchophorus ferrugineus TaxID=354439 RepID=A0A834ID77_RHYFE|nr:hypothetical protein GWI33_008082 [Rhynchophorus ferrugineus]
MRCVPVLCLLVLVALCEASPAKYQRAAPRIYMISYYASPRHVRQENPESLEEPETADTPQGPEFQPQQDAAEEQEAPAETTESVALAAAEPSDEPSADPAEADSDEDDGPGSWPFNGAGSGQASYNTFFPLFIGENSGSTRANSLSIGKGNVASSHATSFGI